MATGKKAEEETPTEATKKPGYDQQTGAFNS